MQGICSKQPTQCNEKPLFCCRNYLLVSQRCATTLSLSQRMILVFLLLSFAYSVAPRLDPTVSGLLLPSIQFVLELPSQPDCFTMHYAQPHAGSPEELGDVGALIGWEKRAVHRFPRAICSPAAAHCGEMRWDLGGCQVIGFVVSSATS